jgi:hypothetical protein
MGKNSTVYMAFQGDLHLFRYNVEIMPSKLCQIRAGEGFDCVYGLPRRFAPISLQRRVGEG